MTVFIFSEVVDMLGGSMELAVQAVKDEMFTLDLSDKNGASLCSDAPQR